MSFDPNSALICNVNRTVSQDGGTQKCGSSLSDAPRPAATTQAAGSTPADADVVAGDVSGAPKTIEICVNGVKQTILVPDVQDTSDDFFNFFPGSSSTAPSEPPPPSQSGPSSSSVNSCPTVPGAGTAVPGAGTTVPGAGADGTTRVTGGIVRGAQSRSSKTPVVVDLCFSDPETSLPAPPPPPSAAAPVRPRSPVDVKFRAHITQNGQQQQQRALSDNYGVTQFGSFVDQSHLYQDILQNNALQTTRTNPHHGAGGAPPAPRPEYWSRPVDGFTTNSVGCPPNPGFLNPRGFPRSFGPCSSGATYQNSVGGGQIGLPMYDQTRFREPNFENRANFSNAQMCSAAQLRQSTLNIMANAANIGGNDKRPQPVQWGVKTPGAAMQRRVPTPGEPRPGQYSHLVSALGDMITSSNGYFYSYNSLLPPGNSNSMATQAGGYSSRVSSQSTGISDGLNGSHRLHNPNVTDAALNPRRMISPNLTSQLVNQNIWNYPESSVQGLNCLDGVSVNPALPPQETFAVNGQTYTPLANNYLLGPQGGVGGNMSVGVAYANNMAGNVVQPQWSNNNAQTPNRPVRLPTSILNPSVGGLPRASNNSPLTTRYLSLMQQRQGVGYVPTRPPIQTNDGIVRPMYQPASSDSFPGGNVQSMRFSGTPWNGGEVSPMRPINPHPGPSMITNNFGLYSATPGMSNGNQLSEIRTNAETFAPNQFPGTASGHFPPFQQSGMTQRQLPPLALNCSQPPPHGMTTPLEPSVNFGSHHSPRILPNYQPPNNDVTLRPHGTTIATPVVTSALSQSEAIIVEWLNQSMPPQSEHPPILSHDGAGCTGTLRNKTACQHSEEFSKTFSDLCGSLVDSLLNKSPRSDHQAGASSSANNNQHSPRKRNVTATNQSNVSEANVACCDAPLSAKSKKTPKLKHLLNAATDLPGGSKLPNVTADVELTSTKKQTARKTVRCKNITLPTSSGTVASEGRDSNVPLSVESINGDKSTVKERASLCPADLTMLREQTIAALDRTPSTGLQESSGPLTSNHGARDSDDVRSTKLPKDGRLSKTQSRKTPSTVVKSKSQSKLTTASDERASNSVGHSNGGSIGNTASKLVSASAVEKKDSSENRQSVGASDDAPKQTTFVRKTCENYSFYNSRKTPAKLFPKLPSFASSNVTVSNDVAINNSVKVDCWMLSNDASVAKTKHSDGNHSTTKHFHDLIDPNELANKPCDAEDALINSNDCGSSNVDSLMDLFPELSDMDSTTGVGDQLDRDSCLRSFVDSTTNPSVHVVASSSAKQLDKSGVVQNRSATSLSLDDVSVLRAKYKSVGKSPENSLRGRVRYKSVGKSPRFVQCVSVKRKRKRTKKINSLSGGSADDSNDSWYIPEEDIDTPPSPVSSKRRRKRSTSSSSWASDDSVTIGKTRRKKRRRKSDDDDFEDDPPQCDWPRGGGDRRKIRRSVRKRISNNWWVREQQSAHDISDCSVSLERLYLRRRRAVNARDIARYLCCAPKRDATSHHHRALMDSDDESRASSYARVKKASRIVYFSDTDEDDATTLECQSPTRSVSSSANTPSRSVVTTATHSVTSSVVNTPMHNVTLVVTTQNGALPNEECSSTLSDASSLSSHTLPSGTTI